MESRWIEQKWTIHGCPQMMTDSMGDVDGFNIIWRWCEFRALWGRHYVLIVHGYLPIRRMRSSLLMPFAETYGLFCGALLGDRAVVPVAIRELGSQFGERRGASVA